MQMWGEQGPEQRKKTNDLPLNLTVVFISKTKQQLSVANLKTWLCPVALSDVSWHLFCLS